MKDGKKDDRKERKRLRLFCAGGIKQHLLELSNHHVQVNIRRRSKEHVEL